VRGPERLSLAGQTAVRACARADRSACCRAGACRGGPRIRSAVDRARASEAPFAAAVAKARPDVAAATGAAAGSERWIAGQIAASSVEPLREPAAAALSDLEQELRLVAQQPVSADRTAVEAAIAEVSAIAARQQQEASALSEQLSD
jgi:hypothetical protein